jgi:integrase
MAYSLEDHRKIVEFTRNNGQLYWIYYLLISTGMRFGEAVALTWDDVDLKKKTIRIHKTSVEMHGSPIIQEHTKTSSGTRTISISDNVVTFLKEVKNSQEKELNYRNLVMCNTRYGIITSANTRKRWQKVCATLDIEYQGVHSLRHTWATRALEKGIDVKVVSHMLGHKNVITTMNIYQDVLPAEKEKAAKQLDDLF